MTEPTMTNGDNSRGREVRNTLVHLLLLAAVCFLVWQLAVMLKGRADTASRLERLDSAAGDGREPETQPMDTAMLRTSPSSAVGLQQLKDKDPLDIAPPEGAKRNWAYRRHIADRFEDLARYSFTGEQSAAAEHYKAAFREKGFTLLSELDADANAKRLVFKRDSSDAIVSLRKKAADGKIIGISVLVMHPAAE